MDVYHVFDVVVSVIAGILFLLTAWAVMTGRHDRYYGRLRHWGKPSRRPPQERRR